MAKSSITLRYSGKADAPITWDTFLGIFDAIWGEEARSLPSYPEVIGGINASWEDADSVTHKVDLIDELGQAYQQEKTTVIWIQARNIGPESTFRYWPAKAEVEFVVSAKNRALASKYIDIVRREFPVILTMDDPKKIMNVADDANHRGDVFDSDFDLRIHFEKYLVEKKDMNRKITQPHNLEMNLP